MSERASWSDPSRTARTSAPPASRVASSATPSPTGVAALTTTAAIACASASIPVIAVIPGGSPQVRTGSTSACWARRSGLAMPALVWVASSVMTAPPETSEPVPAVVGTHTSGIAGGV